MLHCLGQEDLQQGKLHKAESDLEAKARAAEESRRFSIRGRVSDFIMVVGEYWHDWYLPSCRPLANDLIIGCELHITEPVRQVEVSVLTFMGIVSSFCSARWSCASKEQMDSEVRKLFEKMCETDKRCYDAVLKESLSHPELQDHILAPKEDAGFE